MHLTDDTDVSMMYTLSAADVLEHLLCVADVSQGLTQQRFWKEPFH